MANGNTRQGGGKAVIMRFEGTGRTAMTMAMEANRLESPAMVGYRFGMTPSRMIGCTLGTMYDIPFDTPRELAALLRALDLKLSR